MRSLIYILSLATFILTGCEKTILLDLNEAESKVVIEGQLTNRGNHQYVKVTRTSGFYDDGKTPRVTDADVSITDDLGNQFTFEHNPGGVEGKEGYYFPTTIFAGAVGRTYTLHVLVDGKTYEAADKMLPVTPIDSIINIINAYEYNDPEVEGKYYQVLLYAKEPQQTRDYYLFRFYRNDTLALDSPSDIYFSDDRALGEEIHGVASPMFFSYGDRVRVEMFSLTRQGYVFYNDLFQLLNNDGGMFNSPPVNCRTNLTNGALGFFQVSSLSASSIEIK